PFMKLLWCSVGFVLFAASATPQTPPPAGTPQIPSASQPVRRPRPKPLTIQVTVRDQGGAPIPYAHITVFGAVNRTVITNADGGRSLWPLPDGTYRVRFEHEKFVTLERELTVRNGQPGEFEVEMTAIPGAAAPPPPAPEAPAPTPPPATVAAPSGPPITLSIP